MPVNIAHMLICNKAAKVLQDGRGVKIGVGSNLGMKISSEKLGTGSH